MPPAPKTKALKSNSSDPDHLSGQCNCGAITYIARGPFRPPIACHCKCCRRQSGHYLAATEVDASDLDVLTGSDMINWFAATDHALRGFCRTCGAHLFWKQVINGEKHNRISLMMGALNEPTGLNLARHIFVEEIGDYYDLDEPIRSVKRNEQGAARDPAPELAGGPRGN